MGTLTWAESWCEFIPLVFNIKACTYEIREDQTVLTFFVGRKFYDPPEEAFRVAYRFRIPEQSQNHFLVELVAPKGPHGTRDYRIELEVRAAAAGRSAIRMHSSFRPSLRSKLATWAYLSSSGEDKVGFSVRGQSEEGPIFVRGMRGIIERNAMRYYLALKAFLDTQDVPEGQRFEARLHAWFRMTEKYPRQLYEMEEEEYVKAKREEKKYQEKLQRQLAE